jgi:hypothetical protein
MASSMLYYQYQANIIYKHDKDESLATELVVRLEAEGLKVYYHERDCGYGKSLLSSIEEAMKDSDYVILVITESFLSDNLSAYMSQLSQLVSFQKATWDRVIPLCFGGVKPEQVFEHFGHLCPINVKRANVLEDKNAFKKLVERLRCKEEGSILHHSRSEPCVPVASVGISQSASASSAVTAGDTSSSRSFFSSLWKKMSVSSLIEWMSAVSLSSPARHVQPTDLSCEANKNADICKVTAELHFSRSDNSQLGSSNAGHDLDPALNVSDADQPLNYRSDDDTNGDGLKG